MPWIQYVGRFYPDVHFVLGDVEPYELEDYLGEIINNEFDTIVDDGSLEQVHNYTTHDLSPFDSHSRS